MKGVFEMKNPLISIILPIYNVQAYLDKCMKSLFLQTYENLEFVMIDDGSDIECSKLCDTYLGKDARVVVYHKKNGGLSDARNYGINRATGEYITCIDPDDYVDCDYVEYLYKILVKYKAKMSIAQHRVYYDNGSIKENGTYGDEALKTEQCLERMLYHDVIDTSAWGKLYHKSLFEKVKYPKGKLFEDIGTTYALMLQCDYIAVGYESKYNYIFHNNSIVNGKFNLKKLDLIEMTDLMATDVLNSYPNLEKAVKRRQLYARFSTLNQMLNVGEEFEKEKKEIVNYIKKNKMEIFKNKRAPKRDKIAVFLFSINYSLYKFCWLTYQNRIMNGDKKK